MSSAELAERTLRVLDDGRRWSKGGLYNRRDDTFCLVGAINQAHHLSWAWNETDLGLDSELITFLERVMDVIAREDPVWDSWRATRAEVESHNGSGIVYLINLLESWNDRGWRGWDEVRVVLEKVAAE